MSSNDVSTSRMKIIVGAITFEIEGTETLVKEGMTYAKENILTESVREAAKRLPIEEKPVVEVMSVRDYHDQKNPSNDMERVVVFTNYAREYSNVTEVSEAELLPLFHELRTRIPKDLGQAIRNTARRGYGYLEYTGRKGYYRITNAGINLVNELPRVKK